MLLGAESAWADDLSSLYVRASFINDWSPASMTLSTTTGNRIWSKKFTAAASDWGTFQFTPGSGDSWTGQIGAATANIPITLEKKFSGNTAAHNNIVLIVTKDCEYTIYYDETENEYWAEATSPAVVYFYNTLGWSEIYLHLDAYWNDGDRGAGNNNVWNRNYTMSRIGETNYWMCKFTGSHTTIAFTNASRPEVTDFYDVAAIYRSDFASVPESPVFVPCKVSSEKKKDGHTTYYNNGAWISYDATSFSRSKAVNGFGTICSPVNATITGGTLYEVIGRKSGVLYLREKDSEATTLVAGTPYFYKASAGTQTIALDGATYSGNALNANGLYGTYTKTEITSGSNYFVLSNNNILAVNDGNCYVGANRAYLKMNTGADGEVPELNAVPASAPERPIIAMPLEPDNATNLEAFEVSEKAVKFIQNGKLFIMREGVVYDATGRVVR